MFGITRDSAMLWIAVLGSAIAYLITTQVPPNHWTYMQWLQALSAAALWGSGKLQNSPAPSSGEVARGIRDNGKILAVLLMVALGLSAGCAVKTTPLQQVQVTHDALATAQDLEVGLCLGVPSVAAASALSDVGHCTTATAAAIGLTDARHAAIQGQFLTAINLHQSIAAQFKSGATKVDLSSLSAVITALLAEIAQLHSTPAVQQLATVVSSARIK